MMNKLTRLLRLHPALWLGLAACSGGDGLGLPGQPPGNPPPTGSPPTSIQTQQVFAGVTVTAPTGMVQAPDDPSRWFAISQAGVVTVFDNDPVSATGSTFLDISARVAFVNEAGLLGIAFHPDFETNGEVYLSYTAPSPLRSVVSRFRSTDGNLTLDPATEEILFTVTQPLERTNHNGGDMRFGPDGYLYVAFGDGGGSGDPNMAGQNPATLLGSIVRIDVDVPSGYGIPPGNPFAANQPCVQGVGGAGCPEIFAWGFRNPWRISFDRLRGDLWAGDVGQGAWEEVDRVTVGENYGWNIREGAHCYPPGANCSTVGLVDPITEYDHSLGQAITGGFVYRGTANPELVGYYVFGDFVSGRIFAVAANSPIDTDPIILADTAHSISSFAEGEDGELYLMDYSNGSIHQLVP